MDHLEFVAMREEIWLRAEQVLADMYVIIGEDEDGDPVPFHLHTYGSLVIEQIGRLIDQFEETRELEARENRLPDIRLKTFRDFLKALETRKR